MSVMFLTNPLHFHEAKLVKQGQHLTDVRIHPFVIGLAIVIEMAYDQ